MRRMFAVSGGLLVALFVCAPAAGAVTPPGEGSVRSFAVDARIGASGGLHVQETVAYDLGSRHGHGFTQTLRHRVGAGGRDRVYDYSNVTVTSPDAPLRTTVDRRGDATVIRARGGPATGRRTFVVGYDVRGALTPFRDHDALAWSFVEDGWDVPLAGVSVTVHAPAAVSGLGCWATLTRPVDRCTTVARGSTALFRGPRLAPHERLNVVLALPKGAAGAVSPVYEARPSVFRATWWGIGLAALLLVPAVLLYAQRRPPRSRTALAGPVSGPPAGVRPGHAAILLRRGRRRIPAATLLDLAARGHLHVGWAEDEWVLTRRRGEDDLLRGESALLNWVFEHGPRTRLSELAGRGSAERAARDAVREFAEDCARNGWTWRTGTLASTAGRPVIFVSTIATLAAISGTVFGFSAAWADGVGYAPFAALLTGAVLSVVGSWPTPTSAGGDLLPRLRAYRTHLNGDERPSGGDLAYAVVFGAAEAHEQRIEALSTWYRGADLARRA